jgi:hypothetical protein
MFFYVFCDIEYYFHYQRTYHYNDTDRPYYTYDYRYWVHLCFLARYTYQA